MARLSFFRRQALQTLAAAPLTLPLFRAFAGTPAGKRLVIFMQNNGTQQANFWPTGAPAFTSPILEPLLRHATLAAKTTLIKGMYMPSDSNGTSANQHDQGFARMFTGARLLSVGGKPWAGGPSVDQILAEAWDTSSFTLAVLTSRVEPRPKPGFDHRRSFSYVDAGRHKLPIVDPFVAYEQLFGAGSGGGGGADAAATVPGDGTGQKRLALRRSVLDAVNGNLMEVRARLGRGEQAKLDQHASAIRDLEKRLEESLRALSAGQSPVRGGACGARPRAPRNFGASAPALLVNDESAIPELLGLMIDIGATALTCGLTRIVTIQLGFGGGKWNFAWEGIDVNHHDLIAHRDTSDAGSSPENTQRLVKINRFFAAQLARMALALEATPDGAGNVLDGTLVVWGNELGRGDHSQRNIPVALIGGAGGALTRGGRVIDVGPQIFNRLGCTILNLMGLPARGFGAEPECGGFQGL